MNRLVRWLRRLRRLLIPEVDRLHGEEMDELLARRLERAHDRGPVAIVTAVGREVVDLLRVWRGPGGGERGTEPAARRERGIPGMQRTMTTRGRTTMRWMTEAGRDVRDAARSLRKGWGFTLLAASVLAVGTAGPTVILSVGHALLWRNAPGLEEPDRLVEIGRGSGGADFRTASVPDVEDLRRATTTMQYVAAYRSASLTLSDEAALVSGMYISPEYFELLGIEAGRGRVRTGSDGERGTVVVSHAFWLEHLEADPDPIGRTVRINRSPFTVVGVLEPPFRGHFAFPRYDLFVPLADYETLSGRAGVLEQRGSHWVNVIGRLAAGSTASRADQEVRSLFRGLAERHPETNEGKTATVVPLAPLPAVQMPLARTFVGLLFGLAGLGLAVTCANVAGLFLARSLERRREMALRNALGAPRRGLVRLLLLEWGGIFGLGGVGGFVVADVALRAIPLASVLPGGRAPDVTPDLSVLGMSLGAGLVTALIFGLGPALRITRAGFGSLLGAREVGRSGTGRLRRAFVGIQVAVSIGILAAAGMFLRSIQEGARIPTGFDAEGVFVTSMRLRSDPIPAGRLPAFLRAVVENAGDAQGSVAAAVATDLPMNFSSPTNVIYPDVVTDSATDARTVTYHAVTGGYFRTLGVPILAGRAFGETDLRGGEPVAVVSRALADGDGYGGGIIGRTIRIGSPQGPLHRVIGIAGDVRDDAVTDPFSPTVYVPAETSSMTPVFVLLRTRATGGEAARHIRDAVAAADPQVAIGPVSSLARTASVALLPQRVAAGFASVLGAVAFALTVVGLYGTVTFLVASSMGEMAVRVAVGARGRDLLSHVVRRSLGMTGLGVVAGLVLASGLGLVLRRYLIGLGPMDPASLAAAAVAVGSAVLASSVVPALRAARVDPTEALRSD